MSVIPYGPDVLCGARDHGSPLLRTGQV